MINRNPIQWALLPIKRYATFSGRAPRAEFWWFFLFVAILFGSLYALLIGSVMSIDASGAGPPSAGFFASIGIFAILIFVLWLALLVPTIAVQARRLHDTGRSGWWLGIFYLLYLLYLVLWFGSVGIFGSTGFDESGEVSSAFTALFAAGMILGFVLFAYIIVLLVFWSLPGSPGANRYGPDPYERDVGEVFA